MNTRTLLAMMMAVAVTVSCGKEKSDTPPVHEISTDLTAGDAYANCFIVSGEGRYRFAPVHIDGSRIEGIEKADWIWSEKNSQGSGMVRDVTFHDDSVYFTAGSDKGNALIGVLSEDGKILWSWHVWMTDVPAYQQLDNGTVFMNRNLGAVSASPDTPALTYGLRYQWGRKDPFYGGASNETKEEAVFERAAENTVLNPDLSLAWKAVEKTSATGTVEYATENPMTFIYTTDVERDWLMERNDYLWSTEDTGAKANYDPCPAGYRVANDGDWAEVGYWNVKDDAVNGGRTHTTEAGEVFWWPLSGARWGDSDAGRLGYVGVNGTETVWMRTTVNCGTNAASFYVMQGTYVSNSYSMYRAHGVSVRCTFVQ